MIDNTMKMSKLYTSISLLTGCDSDEDNGEYIVGGGDNGLSSIMS